jgi:hypothetical protein
VVVFVRKVKETRIDPLRLKDVEQTQPIRFRKAVVECVVDDKLWGAKVRDVVLGIEFLVGGVRVVDCTVEIVADKPEFCSYVSGALKQNPRYGMQKLICIETLTLRSVCA